MIEVRAFTDRFARRSLTDIERVLPVDGQLSSFAESLTGRYSHSPNRPARVIRVAFYGVGEQPKWLVPTIQRIADIADLPANWDSYGAPQIDLESVVGAFEVLILAMNSAAMPPTIVPGKRGGIQLEWHQASHSLEIGADRIGGQAYYSNDETGQEWEVPWRQNQDQIMAALRDFRP
jgi:hypothetical protein